ncbi:hypothetical protein ACFE04_024063 [Oxalis oulophora]
MGRVAVGVIVSIWLIPISILVNHIVPHPYMDEIFHVPQAQQYCKGNFKTWDPMITTPPALYCLSVAHVASLFPGMYFVQAVSSFPEACSTAILRSINGILAVLCSIIVYEIITHLRPTVSDRKATLQTVVLALYPLNWFFSYLYYTDVASLTVVLAMYLASLKKKYLFSALLGAFAVSIRQTNIIWMLFVACTGVIDITMPNQRNSLKVDNVKSLSAGSNQLNLNNSVGMGSNLRRRKSATTVNDNEESKPITQASSRTYGTGLLDEIGAIILTSWHMKWKLLICFSPFFMALAAFVAFVIWNGSVVLGAKEAHAVSPHFAQILYFALVSTLLMAPLHLTLGPARDLFRSFQKNNIAHPYLLADNRHYPFYLWRKVINANQSMKYLLIPVYVYSWFSIVSILAKAQRKIWILVFTLATAAVLIPTPLIEFRYYTIPFFFIVLHSQISDNIVWILLGVLYIAINIFTMAMFLFRPFNWSHEPGIQRFIW